VPRLGPEHVAIGVGSTQLTHDLFRTLLDPGDTVLLMDPTYANYEGQLAFAAPGTSIVRLRLMDPDTWTYLPATDPDRVIADFARVFDAHRPRLVLFGAPDNPTSQILPQALVDAMRARTEEAGAWLAIDYAYKCQYFAEPPAYYAWSPADHPNVIGIHSNSKWGRGLGRRLGWLTAAPPIVDAVERVQQCSLLCPDTLSQMTMARSRQWTSTSDAGGWSRWVASTRSSTWAQTPTRSSPARCRPRACSWSRVAASGRRSPTASASRTARWSPRPIASAKASPAWAAGWRQSDVVRAVV
jgi:DNA-binding transcriptional MocR family regulator